METESIFHFNDPKEYLGAVLAHRQKTNPRYSLRAWANQAGLRHHSMLSMVLNGKRRLKPALAGKIRETLKLSDSEKRYFDVLVHYQNAGSDSEREFYQGILSDLHPSKSFHVLSMDLYQSISEWYHYAILELTQIKDFNSDPKWIACRLGGDVSEAQVKNAIERLVRVGLLQKQDDTLVPVHESRFTPDDVPSKAVRNSQKQGLDQAKVALDEQPLEDREFMDYTFCLKKDSMDQAKSLVREFRQKMASLVEAKPGEGDEVYRLGVQLFALTDLKHSGEDK